MEASIKVGLGRMEIDLDL